MENAHPSPTPVRPSPARLMRLRLVFTAISGAAVVVLSVVMSLASHRGTTVHPLLLMIPVAAWIGFGVLCSEQRCPRCGEKFFGDVLRFFFARSCQHCGVSGTEIGSGPR